MRAWEMERKIMDEAIPKILTEEEQTWDFAETLEKIQDDHTKLLWRSNVPGSYAPESIMTAAVQSVENMGYRLPKAVQLLEEGFKAMASEDLVTLNRVSAKIWKMVHLATSGKEEAGEVEKDEAASYWNYRRYDSFEDYLQAVSFKERAPYSGDKKDFSERIYAGWLAQIIGGAMGTAIEGYTTKNIENTFGEIRDYVREPNTYNDDITYELAFLKAYEEKGSKITAEDIALRWIELIPLGWSAEEIALRNIRYGIFPPASGYVDNPFREWIGAQMRGAICGMVAPGDPMEAARLAWIDACVSHANNGILGEIFNAVLVSLSFVETDIRKILEETIGLMPKDSEYYQVVRYAHELAKEHPDWKKAWAFCEEHLKEYNWIHAYPNAAAEVLALYYGEGDFDQTMYLIAMMGQDVDCNAAQIMTVIGIIGKEEKIPQKWKDPIGDRLQTYVRTMKDMSIRHLANWTVDCVESVQ